MHAKDRCECFNDSITGHISFQIAEKLTKDFDELIQSYEEDLNGEMLLKGPLRIGLVVQLHSKVGRTEYLKTATSVAHILKLNKIPWSQSTMSDWVSVNHCVWVKTRRTVSAHTFRVKM